MKTKNFYYKSNRLQQLRGFCLTARLGSISRAAKQLKLSHAAVSVQIKSLERDLETSLFDRNGPYISLTQEGQKLLDLADPLVEGLDNVGSLFHKDLEAKRRTEIAIAANSTSLNFILPSLIKDHLRLHPDIHLSIHYAEQAAAVEKLREHEVDLALLPRREHMPIPNDITFEARFKYTPSLITRRDHPLAGKRNLRIADIGAYELALPDKELRVIPNLYDIFSRNRVNERLRINFVDWETTRKYIEIGLVISISSDVIIGKNDELVATPLPHLFNDVEYGFMYLKRRRLSEQADAFIKRARR
jgi:DNA-binding transcriptional LysR family regulator